MNQETWAAVRGATRYEFKMQIRRGIVWIILPLGILLSLTGPTTPWRISADTPLIEAVTEWALLTQILLPVLFGILLADRLPRDKRIGVNELFETMPSPAGGRFLGKYLGSTMATLIPILVFYLFGVTYLLVARGDWLALPLGLLVFVTVNLPGLLFVAAFSIACPAVIWTPLYQFLFVGYWVWGNLLLQGPSSGLYIPIPSLSHTLLTPIGFYIAGGLYGVYTSELAATFSDGLISIFLLVSGAVIPLVCAHHYLRWQQARQ